MRWWQKGCLAILIAIGLVWLASWVVYGGAEQQSAGEIARQGLKQETVRERRQRQKPIVRAPSEQILFGDLHVHTTFSADAFLWSVPLMGGEGVHPPADACDFARFCSQLDFFALTDHAEAISPRMWQESKETVRQCNAVAGGAEDPDLVAFTGFEWTQIGLVPEDHYGHKNVIFKDTAEARLPTRPIGTPGIVREAFNDVSAIWTMMSIPVRDFWNRKRYVDVYAFLKENGAVPVCDDNLHVRDLSPNCRESAATPDVLFKKLRQWGFDSIVIPHGMTWGFYTPRGNTWDKQLRTEQDDPQLQTLVEVFSGHGNSEEYRDWRGVEEVDGELRCPEPSEDYEPCCWRAGEIIRSRCGDASAEECERRVKAARNHYLHAGIAAHLVIPGADVEDWKNCGQCTDCFNPAFNYRPGAASQYILARGNFTDPEAPKHASYGFIASSDIHSARPGTGYKEFARRKMTEARGATDPVWKDLLFGLGKEPEPESKGYTLDDFHRLPPFQLMFLERQASFFVTGGLVAAHTQGRSRDEIWNALKRREVYGTSGDRILLWFDLENTAQGSVPMGSEFAFSAVPRFRVRAAGAFEQKPGCSDEVLAKLGQERVDHICAGECYYPSDRRRRITRVEVIRIRRQMREDEDVADLIEDVWKTLPCPQDREVCEVVFEDPEYPALERSVVYYVRAIQEPTPAVNAGQLRCTEQGCQPCYGNYRTPETDDCLTLNEERAWSSPIYLRPAVAHE